MVKLDPWRRVASLETIDPIELRQAGVRLVLLDRDNTCVPRGEIDPPQEVIQWCARAKSLGLALWLVSNNWSKGALRRTAETLGCSLEPFALKPLPFGLWRAMEKAGVPREQTVLVGDQLFTDVAGGRLAGIRVIMVNPQSPKDLPHTLLLRRFEKFFLTQESGDAHLRESDGVQSPLSARAANAHVSKEKRST